MKDVPELPLLQQLLDQRKIPFKRSVQHLPGRDALPLSALLGAPAYFHLDIQLFKISKHPHFPALY
jgi:hypothetical protein